MTAPTTEFVDPMRNVRPILWVLLVGGTLASLAGNVTHAVMHAPAGTFPLGPVIAAVLAPAALLGLVHLMGVWARDSRGGGAMQGFLLSAVAGIGAVAFRLSFSAVRDLAKSYGYGTADAALFPVMLDGVIVICTVSLVAASRLTDRARDAHAEAVHTANPEPAVHDEPAQPVFAPEPVHQVAQPSVVQRPTQRLEQATHRPEAHHSPIAPSVIPAAYATVEERPTEPHHEPVVQQPHAAPQLVPHESVVQPELASSWDDVDTAPVVVQAVERPMKQVAQPDAEPVEQLGAPDVERTTSAVEQSSRESVKRPAEQLEQSPHESVVQSRGPLRVVHAEPVVQPDGADVEQTTRAEMVHQRGGFTCAVEDVERVLALTDQGLSQRKIADATGIGSSTVGRMQKTAAELDEPVPVA
ncbi:Protein of uncharacterised function (DUF2637) [Mycobacteroides abscessus subsp. abscessus]|uniref:DUF2637 domain-containing protein n=1 Tax=Mycobacteroides abscessus TaxID=36809 RepID=UPI00092A9662|nr:DUF2637 domain-containing protein [Mycobacteroides abscessus]SHX65975.1 Protein of uncharacterised function (DUF2637) [Mycobacteroides abscessus subsp. abscessus]SIC60714.1 Protein of uncharacterised function (DUF2637) [Mycobacteroides abscessus subsp. abscessus]SKK21381.1 Protein of uncharacterised function (DUF2637) [Mycobacteroides abscessus subsp. abscessus]SKP50687.1 Protein of uncharacterised function (DUF2637) [Mycobacteroides abscessus subsp. abscessus]